jgi:hypothetical protein
MSSADVFCAAAVSWMPVAHGRFLQARGSVSLTTSRPRLARASCQLSVRLRAGAVQARRSISPTLRGRGRLSLVAW